MTAPAALPELPGGIGRWVPVVIISVLAIPAAILAMRVLARRRVQAGMPQARAWRTAVAEVGMVAGTAPWLWMILTPLPEPRHLHLLPLVDLWNQLHHPVAVFFQVVGNMLVFSAFGFLAPVRWRVGPLWVMAVAAAGSATVEALQWLLDLGRVTSIDDVLVNAAGAGLASLASRRWWAAHAEPGHLRQPLTRPAS
jgi:hypothetical protein